MAAVLRGLRNDLDDLWGAVRRRGVGGGGGGGTGPQGPPGPPAGFGTPSASATGLASGANPTANVVASGPDTAKIFQFSFGIPAGAQGPPGSGGGGGGWYERRTPTTSTTGLIPVPTWPSPGAFNWIRGRAKVAAAGPASTLYLRFNNAGPGVNQYFGNYAWNGSYNRFDAWDSFLICGVPADGNCAYINFTICRTDRPGYFGDGFAWSGGAPAQMSFGGTWVPSPQAGGAINNVALFLGNPVVNFDTRSEIELWQEPAV